MSPAALDRLLRSLGVLVVRDALDRAQAAEMVDALGAARTQPAAVGGGLEPAYSDTARQADLLEPTDSDLQRMATLFSEMRPGFASFFQRSVGEMEPIGFLRYRTGGFHAAHADTADDVVSDVKYRTISVVLFLNDGSTGPDPRFEDGTLVFYDLLPGDEWAGRGMAVEPTAGTLVAFPSDVVHEVRPVASGERFSVVTWFH